MKLISYQYKKQRVYIISGILVAVVLVMGIGYARAIKNQLNEWKLLPQAEPLTELYFNNSSKLPTTYTPNKSQSFSFVVHNLEYRKMGYHFEISAVGDNNNSMPLQSGTFYLSQNQYKNIQTSFITPDLGSRIQIVVALTNPNESIDYWVKE